MTITTRGAAADANANNATSNAANATGYAPQQRRPDASMTQQQRQFNASQLLRYAGNAAAAIGTGGMSQAERMAVEVARGNASSNGGGGGNQQQLVGTQQQRQSSQQVREGAGSGADGRRHGNTHRIESVGVTATTTINGNNRSSGNAANDEMSKLGSFMLRQQQPQRRTNGSRRRPQNGTGGGQQGQCNSPASALSPRSDDGMSYMSRMKHDNYANVVLEMKNKQHRGGSGRGPQQQQQGGKATNEWRRQTTAATNSKSKLQQHQ